MTKNFKFKHACNHPSPAFKKRVELFLGFMGKLNLNQTTRFGTLHALITSLTHVNLKKRLTDWGIAHYGDFCSVTK